MLVILSCRLLFLDMTTKWEKGIVLKDAVVILKQYPVVS